MCYSALSLYIYIKNLLKMDSVYDCARPFMLVAGIFGMGGSRICEIDGVRSVRNTRFSWIIAALITLVITPGFFVKNFYRLFLSGQQRSLVDSTVLILSFGTYAFFLSTAAVTCIRTHVYCKNLTKVLQILNDTDMMLKQENIQVNYWKIVLKTILLGLILCNYLNLYGSVILLSTLGILYNYGIFLVKLFCDIACVIFFIWIIPLLLVIRERFVGLNKLLLQNAQVPSIMQDDSLLRRISLARNIHEQLSEAVELFSDISRFLIIGVLVPGMLDSLSYAVSVAETWNEPVGDNMRDIYDLLGCSYLVVVPIMKIVILTAVCEAHKNNRRVLNARLRYLISREEDPRTVQQLQQYIWYIYDTPPGMVDFQLIEVDFTLLFTVIDITVQYLFVIWSYYRLNASETN